MKWHPIESAPVGIRLLLWGGGPMRFGIKDALGNWRATHRGPIKGEPKYWALPKPPTLADQVSTKPKE